MKSTRARQSIFSVELKGSKSAPNLPHKVEVPANRAVRRLEEKMARRDKSSIPKKDTQ